MDKQDRIKMKQLAESNKDFQYIISQLEKDHAFTLSKISHEIRNPLTFINSSLQLIQSSHPEVKDFLFWNDTMEDIQYLRLLLDDLSNFNNSTRLKKHFFDLPTLLSQIISSFSAGASQTGRSINLITDSFIPEIYGDPVKLKQALINLIKNAIEATDENTGVIYIKTRLRNRCV